MFKRLDFKSWVILILLGLFIASSWLVVNEHGYAESQRIELERAKKRLKVKEDSLVTAGRELADLIHQSEEDGKKKDSLAKTANDKAEFYRKKYEKIVFTRLRDNHQRDSLLRVVLQ